MRDDQRASAEGRAPRRLHPRSADLLSTVTRDPFRNRGRITDLITSGKLFADIGLPGLEAAHDRVMICGSPALVTDTRVLLGERGFIRAITASRPSSWSKRPSPSGKSGIRAQYHRIFAAARALRCRFGARYTVGANPAEFPHGCGQRQHIACAPGPVEEEPRRVEGAGDRALHDGRDCVLKRNGQTPEGDRGTQAQDRAVRALDRRSRQAHAPSAHHRPPEPQQWQLEPLGRLYQSAQGGPRSPGRG